MRPRTENDFQEWFSKLGDPWGCDKPAVQQRYKNSLRFIKKHLGNFSGIFVELGAFDGRFSAQLHKEFPEARLVINDISEYALQLAKVRVPQGTFIKGDLLNL